MNQKNNISPIVNKLIPICLSCNSIPLFLSLTHTSQYDIIFNYKCKCSSDGSVILSQYLENLFIYTKILLFKCFCEKRASYDCSKCDLLHHELTKYGSFHPGSFPCKKVEIISETYR